MTKQEEIREGIETILAALEIKHLSSTGYTDEILTYLHSKGCVIKVDRELPKFSSSEYTAFQDGINFVLDEGYISVEELV